MTVLIIEDETPAARRLAKLIQAERPSAHILPAIESVEQAVEQLKGKALQPDLIFMDIQLADGLSFDIFSQVPITSPVVFTTAYDQYTLKAFKVNSIDYLLKPIDPEELNLAFDKFDRLFNKRIQYDLQFIQSLSESLVRPEYKERFLIKAGQHLSFITTQDIRYFYSEGGLVYARTKEGKKHNIDYTLEQLAGLLQPRHFFRINRKVIIAIEAIRKISPYFNNRLALEAAPSPTFDLIVSRDRVPAFKNWLDQ